MPMLEQKRTRALPVWRKQSHSVYAAITSTDAMTSIGATDIRNIEVVTPSFDLAPELVLGTDRIATVPTILARKYAALLPIKLLRVPVEIPPLMEVLQWHRTYDHDPANSWLRSQLKARAALMQGAAAPAPFPPEHGTPSHRRQQRGALRAVRRRA